MAGPLPNLVRIQRMPRVRVTVFIATMLRRVAILRKRLIVIIDVFNVRSDPVPGLEEINAVRL